MVILSSLQILNDLTIRMKLERALLSSFNRFRHDDRIHLKVRCAHSFRPCGKLSLAKPSLYPNDISNQFLCAQPDDLSDIENCRSLEALGIDS